MYGLISSEKNFLPKNKKGLLAETYFLDTMSINTVKYL